MSKTMPQSIGRTKTNKKRGMPSGILLLYMCGGGLSVTLIYMLSLIKRSDDMNSSVYRLRLDIHSPTSQELINMNKGETARRIEIEFCENNTAYKLEDNVTAVICISNDTTLYPVKIDGNKVVYEPLAELTGTVGIKDVQVRLMQSMNDTVNPENAETDRLLYSPRFSVAVHDVVNDGSTVEEQAKQGDLIAEMNMALKRFAGRNVFVLNWSSGTEGSGETAIEHPTDAEKQAIVDTLAKINALDPGTYEVLLKVDGRYLPYTTFNGSDMIIFSDEINDDIPVRYEIFAPSVNRYKQLSLCWVEDITFSKSDRRPASMPLTAKYIDEQITNAVGDIESALESITTGGGVA